MFRPTSRYILRRAQKSLLPHPSARTPTITATRCLLTTAAPPHRKSRSWRSSAARWGLALAAIYYYNTSELFAEQPAEYSLDPKAEDHEESDTPTLDAVTQLSRERRQKKAQQSINASTSPEQSSGADHESSPESPVPDYKSESEEEPLSTPSGTDAASLEDEASSEGAFNPATGEINWDCPCLGGMAHGPCGEDFRAAFSCFVFSTEEPKGMDCIEKFQGMQDCFRAHPDIYAAELEGNGEDSGELDAALEEERKELVEDIQERRQGVSGKVEGTQSKKRLLEADPPLGRKSILGGSSQLTPSSPPPPPEPSQSSTPMPKLKPSSSTPTTTTSDAILSGQNSNHTEPNPKVSPTDAANSPEVVDQDPNLVPTAWQDAHQSEPPSSSPENRTEN